MASKLNRQVTQKEDLLTNIEETGIQYGCDDIYAQLFHCFSKKRDLNENEEVKFAQGYQHKQNWVMLIIAICTQMMKVLVLVTFIAEQASYDGYEGFKTQNKDFLCGTDLDYTEFFCIGHFKISTIAGFLLFYFILSVQSCNEWETAKINTIMTLSSEHDAEQISSNSYHKGYEFLLRYSNKARSQLLFPLFRITAIICLAYDIALPSMALNALGINFIFDVDNFLFKLYFGSGSTENIKYDITLPTKSGDYLNKAKQVQFYITFITSSIAQVALLYIRYHSQDTLVSNYLILSVLVFSMSIEFIFALMFEQKTSLVKYKEDEGKQNKTFSTKIKEEIYIVLGIQGVQSQLLQILMDNIIALL